MLLNNFIIWFKDIYFFSDCFVSVGPPYIFYFGVKFYAENPLKLKEETTRWDWKYWATPAFDSFLLNMTAIVVSVMFSLAAFLVWKVLKIYIIIIIIILSVFLVDKVFSKCFSLSGVSFTCSFVRTSAVVVCCAPPTSNPASLLWCCRVSSTLNMNQSFSTIQLITDLNKVYICTFSNIFISYFNNNEFR